MNYKALFFDIDGTLVNSNQEIPESTNKALIQAKEKGLCIFIATGRPESHLQELKKILPIDPDGWITINGQYCYKGGGEVIRKIPIDPKQVRQALDYLDKKDIGAFIVDEEGTYINFIHEGMQKEYLHDYKYNPCDIYDRQKLDVVPIYQLMVHIDLEDADIEENFFSIMHECKGARWNEHSIDVMPKISGKDTALLSFCDFFGFTPESCVAFGDGDNDIDMILVAGMGVAMGNANEQVKQASNYITKTINEDGIYYAMKNLEIL